MIIDRIFLTITIGLLFLKVIMRIDLQYYMNFFYLLCSNDIFFIFLYISFVYLFIRTFKSIVVDYLRPYYFIFKQFNYAIPFIAIVCFFL